MAAVEAECSIITNRRNYFRSLGPDVCTRYEEKIMLISGRDPYCVRDNEWSPGTEGLPEVTYLNMMNYLVFGKSTYSFQDLDAYKSLEAFIQFACGWVRNIRTLEFDEHVLISSNVLHSQRISDLPLNPWIIAQKNGSVSSAHCDCMAGLGEACSHVAAILFFIEATIRLRKKFVTDVPAYWCAPSFRSVPLSQVQDIDFSCPKRKCENNGRTSKVVNKSKRNINIPEQTDEEFSVFLSKLYNTGHPAAILSVVEPYCEKFIPKPQVNVKKIQSLFKVENLDLTYDELVKIGGSVCISLSEREAEEMENSSRQQFRSKNWYVYRAGRITASNFKAVCKVQSMTSSPSLVKALCYPEKQAFKTKATEWGCSHESLALRQYTSQLMKVHNDFKIQKCGLMIKKNIPYFGASPDGIVSCLCCEKGCVEVKLTFL